MVIRHQIRNTFQTSTAQTITVSGGTDLIFSVSGNSNVVSTKFLTIPVNMEFFPIDYGDDLPQVVSDEINKNIGKIFDAETIRYNFYSTGSLNLKIKFRFWDDPTSSFTTSYLSNGFDTSDIYQNKNGFKKSFFRLYFYDSNDPNTDNLLFTEDINVYNTIETIFSFNELYWLRNDSFFIENSTNRIVYMNAKFFNAKTGKETQFNNVPNGPISITDYNNPTNSSWRKSAIWIFNPRVSNGLYNFAPVVPFGANQTNLITLSETVFT